MRVGALVLACGAAAALLAPRAVAAKADGDANRGDVVAGFESAGELLRKCRQSSTYARSFCFAYLAAVADSSRSYRVWIGSGDPCLPAGLTLGKLADVFEAYLIANPSQTEAQAASVIVASLQEGFPCGSSTPVAPEAPAPISSQQGASQKKDRRP